jgi:hypothetical protein
VLAGGARPGEAAAELLRLARGRGGQDDASAIVVDAGARPSPAADRPGGPVGDEAVRS